MSTLPFPKMPICPATGKPYHVWCTTQHPYHQDHAEPWTELCLTEEEKSAARQPDTAKQATCPHDHKTKTIVGDWTCDDCGIYLFDHRAREVPVIVAGRPCRFDHGK